MPAPLLRSIATAFGLLLLAACSGSDGGMPARPSPRIAVVTLEARDVTLVETLPGRASAYLKAEVRPQVSGIVAERLFREGAHVAQGEPLYQLDDALYRAELDHARGNLAQAEATRATASRAASRAEALRKTGAISEQDLDDRRAAHREARAAVQAARAAVNTSDLRLGFARIHAPVAGIISRSNVTRGALVTADQSAAMTTIQQINPMFVDFTRSSAEWLALREQLAQSPSAPDRAVTLILEDGRRYAHPGRLLFSEVTVDPATGSFVLRAEFPNPDMILLPGMFVRGEVSSGIRPNALLVPQRAVLRDGAGEPYVFLYNGDNSVSRRAISVDQTVGDSWLLRDGLVAGDRIVVSGVQNLRDGLTVELTAGPGARPGN